RPRTSFAREPGAQRRGDFRQPARHAGLGGFRRAARQRLARATRGEPRRGRGRPVQTVTAKWPRTGPRPAELVAGFSRLRHFFRKPEQLRTLARQAAGWVESGAREVRL